MDSLVSGRTIDATPTNSWIDKYRNRDLANQHGNNWVIFNSKKKGCQQANKFFACPARGQPSYKWQLLCKCSNVQVAGPGQETTVLIFISLAGQARPLNHPRDCKLVSVSADRTSVWRDSKCLSVSNKCRLSCCKSCTYCLRAATKERRKSGCCKTTSDIKICEQCFLCRSIVICNSCTKCPKCCTKYACRGHTKPVLGNYCSLGARTKSCTNVERGLHPPFPDQIKLVKFTDTLQLLCTSPQEPLPVGGIAVALVKNQESLGFYN